MLPADQDARIVWACFVIAHHLEGRGPSDILSEAREQRMPMTRGDVLKILRSFVDKFDKDVRFTKERNS